MSETTGTKRLNAVVKELNVGMTTLVDFLAKKGHAVEAKPTTKLTEDQYSILLSEYNSEKKIKDEAHKLGRDRMKPKDSVIEIPKPKAPVVEDEVEEDGMLIKSGLVNSPSKKQEIIPTPEVEAPAPIEVPVEKTVEKPVEKIEEKVVEPLVIPEPPAPKVEEKIEKEETSGLKVMGKIDLDSLKKPKSKVKKAEEPIKVEPKVEEKTIVVETPKPEPIVVEKQEPVIVEKPQPEAKPVVEEKTIEPTITPAVEVPAAKIEPEETKVSDVKYEKLEGLKVMGKIVLKQDPPAKKQSPVASSDDPNGKRKRKRKQIGGANQSGNNNNNNNPQGQNQNRPNDPNRPRPPYQGNNNNNRGPGNNQQGGGNRFGNKGPGGPGGNRFGKPEEKTEISDKEIQDKLKATLARLNPGSKNPNIGSVRSKIRKQKRDVKANEREEAMLQEEMEKNKLKVTEFVTANELAQMMDLQITQIISACMSLGMMVSINQRLDAETIAIVAEEFGFEVEFVSAEMVEAVEEELDDPDTLEPRAPIVTVMGHVDHGKTSLLDYVRSANVVKGEAGGITQHIGAYEVKLENGKKITFLDTPGHEAFTAMRARGAKLTDIVIIVIAADDSVMPQTKEAISHAQAAGVPIVFALNKIDRDAANPDRIREQLAAMDILVEEWGGKYQCQEISAKKGLGIESLLDKVLLEAEMLDLKANPNKRAVGNIIEATLDKGRGIVTTVMVQSGTLQVGDPLLAGTNNGKVRAMFDERGKKMLKAGPSTPVVILGFDGAPQAGDRFLVTKNEQEAKEIANKRQQLQREQGIRTNKHITLDEIGRRLAIGNFKELKVIVKGDVDGSVEALADSLIKLSTPEVQLSVIYKAVGQISESDVMLASASDAIIVGFQVRPSPQARRLAETESIDIRMYSVIYNAIEEIKSAIEGMLAPTIEEKILGNAQIREVFKITKVGTVAGCMVTDGKLVRNAKIRLIRDGVVVFSGSLSSLKRFKDDVKEVAYGFDCGLTIHNYNDLRESDYVEAYEEVEVKRTLK
ncbi:MAG: translation initiation factor IF-2 [Bacteroidia bacterium]|nr:translation initiation factor IF-2 [Bacteroidia bacterium]MCF8425667.1 translation initiation factor IF-2 [Bacteroidia bacterium]MCF8447365.1 translation initiation factor IF-2 [Bacteroidia bacterium]